MRIETIETNLDISVKTRQAVENEDQPFKKKKSTGKMCIYMNNTECVPTAGFKLCKTCPYGYIYCFGIMVGNVYKKIIGLAINMFNRDRETPGI